MKHFFEGIGEVTFSKLTEDQIPSAIELIYAVYQSEGIWLDFSKEHIREELQAMFDKTCYRPVYFTALLDNKIIGVASYMEAHISSDAFELSFATILPEYHNKGLGTFFIRLRLQEIASRHKNAMILTRTRRPKLFEKFNFKYIYKMNNQDGVVGPYDYMFCHIQDVDFAAGRK